MNILELLSSHSKYDTQSSEEEKYDCPLCDDEKGHLKLNRKKNVWHCFKCGSGGRVDPLMGWDNKIKTKSIKVDVKTSPVSDIMYKYDFEPIDVDGELGIWESVVYDYFVGRGMTKEQMKRYNLSCCMEDPYSDRGLLFWRRYENACPEYFIARSILPVDPRYLNPSNPKTFLWTTFYLDNVPKKMVLVEGTLDAIWTSNVCPSGAILGSSLSENQVDFIVELYNRGLKELVIMLDKSSIKKKNAFGSYIANETDKAMKIYQQLKETCLTFKIKPVFMEYAKDPGSATLEYLKELINVD